MNKVIVTKDLFIAIEEENNYFYCIYWHRFEDIQDFIREFKKITESIRCCYVQFHSIQKIYTSEELPPVHELTVLLTKENRKVTLPLSYRGKNKLQMQYIAISKTTGIVYMPSLREDEY